MSHLKNGRPTSEFVFFFFDRELKFLNVKLFILDFDLEEKESNTYLFLEVSWDVNLF